MAKKILFRNGLEYRNKETNKVFALTKDYNGLWYLSFRDEDGLTKTSSQSENKMYQILHTYYERV